VCALPKTLSILVIGVTDITELIWSDPPESP